MIQDFLDSPKDAQFETDICIIGAGAAGITLARALKDTGLDILLLESGGQDYEDATQDLAKGENTGHEYYELRESRLRFFGGTTAIWGGRSSQLDAIDFEPRDWVPHSGWPISKADLKPYYAKAQKCLGLEPIPDNDLPGFKNPFDPKKLQTAFWQFDEMFDRFTLPKCEGLKNRKQHHNPAPRHRHADHPNRREHRQHHHQKPRWRAGHRKSKNLHPRHRRPRNPPPSPRLKHRRRGCRPLFPRTPPRKRRPHLPPQPAKTLQNPPRLHAL